MDTLGECEIVYQSKLWLHIFATLVLKKFGKTRLVYFPTRALKDCFMRELRNQICVCMHGIGDNNVKMVRDDQIWFDDNGRIIVHTAPADGYLRGIHADVVFLHWDSEYKKACEEWLHKVMIPLVYIQGVKIYITHIIPVDSNATDDRFATVLSDPFWHEHTPSVLGIINFSHFMDYALALRANSDPQNQPSMDECIAGYPVSKQNHFFCLT